MDEMLVFRISAYRVFEGPQYSDTHKMPESRDKSPTSTVQFEEDEASLRLSNKQLLKAAKIVPLSKRDFLMGFPYNPGFLDAKKKVWIEIRATATWWSTKPSWEYQKCAGTTQRNAPARSATAEPK